MNFGRNLVSAVSICMVGGMVNAATLDLTSAGTGDLNGGTFTTPSSLLTTSGTGVYQPFLRVQSNVSESGYNTDRHNSEFEFDEKAGVWTHSMTYADLLASFSNGPAGTFEFLLDINEPDNNKSLISLDAVRIFNVGADKNADGLSFGDGSDPFGGAFTEIWNMDVGADGDSEVLLDYSLVGTGSGRADMSLFLNQSLFAGASTTDHILFYSAFGNTDDSDAGFEEWAFIASPPPTPVPVPAGLPLILSGLGVFGFLRFRSRKPA